MVCPWYLECNFGTFPLEEEALFESLKNFVVVNPNLNKFAGLNEESKAKAIKRQEISNEKKLDKLEEAKKKADENQKKRLAAQAEKE